MVDLCPAALKLHKGIAASGSLSSIRDQSACHQENYFLIYEQVLHQYAFSLGRLIREVE